jgi:uncharacterized protein YukE
VTQFDINHDGYADANDQLLGHVNEMGDILETLDTVLRNIPDAYGGQAAPVWAEDQSNWQKAYQEMLTNLQGVYGKSIKVAEIFAQGDIDGMRIFQT